jgi:hypothetical protein
MTLVGTAAMVPIKAGVEGSVLAEYVCEHKYTENSMTQARRCGSSMGLRV